MDATTFVIIYLAVLMLVPSTQIIGPIGGAGQPAVILGVALLGFWLFLRVSGSPYVVRRISGLHAAWLCFAIASVASYAAATSRAIGVAEMNGADRGLVFLASWSGTFLLIADGTLTRARLEKLLKYFSAALVLAAVIGMSQYIAGRNWYVDLNFPLLTSSWELGVLERAGFLRITGTAVHAIEYGIVQTMGIALVIHWALFARTRTARYLWWGGFLLIAMSLPLTVARSPVVGMLVVVVMIVPSWPVHWRWRALLAAPFAVVGMRAFFPGVLGTVYSLFAWISTDPSTTGRTEDYMNLIGLLAEHPWLGVGAYTLIPEIYLTLDNQYLYTLLATGFMGLAALAGLMATAIITGFRTRARLGDPESRDLAHSLTTGLTVAFVGFGIFDGFGFPQAAGTFVVLAGAAAALWRLAREGDAGVPESPTNDSATTPLRSRLMPAIAAAIAVLATLGYGIARDTTAGYEYQAEAAILIHPENTEAGLFTSDMLQVSSLIATYMRTDTARDLVVANGGSDNFTIAQGEGSLARVTDRNGYGPIVRIRSTANTPVAAMDTLHATTAVLRQQLERSQGNAPPGEVVVASDIVSPEVPTLVHGAQSRSLLGLVVLSALMGTASYMAAKSLLARRGARRGV